MCILHGGGNDLVHMSRKAVVEERLMEIGWLGKRCPVTEMVWSHMIPRLEWRGGESVKALNNSVKRVNNKMDKVLRSPRLRTMVESTAWVY